MSVVSGWEGRYFEDFKVRTRGIQQEGKIVIDYVRSVLVWKKAHAPTRDLFPKIRE